MEMQANILLGISFKGEIPDLSLCLMLLTLHLKGVSCIVSSV